MIHLFHHKDNTSQLRNQRNNNIFEVTKLKVSKIFVLQKKMLTLLQITNNSIMKKIIVLFLLSLFYSQVLLSQEIVTVDYVEHFEKNGVDSISSKPILSKVARINNKTAISFDISYDDNIPDSVSKCLQVATDIWRNCLNINSDYKIRIKAVWDELPEEEDVITTVCYTKHNGYLYPTSLYCSLVNNLGTDGAPDAKIIINKNKKWYCGYNADNNANYSSLAQAMLRSIAVALGFGSSVNKTVLSGGREIIRFCQGSSSLFDSLLVSSNGACLKSYSNIGARQNVDLLKFVTGQFGDVHISGFNANDSIYKMYTPPVYENNKSLIFLNNPNSLMHYNLNNSLRILQVDSVTANVLNKLGWDIKSQQDGEYSIVGDNIPETGITSAYSSHSFFIEGNGKQTITNRKWTFLLPATDGSDIIVKQSEGDLFFSTDALSHPNDYYININGDVYGKIIFSGDINGKPMKLVYNLTLGLKPEISSVGFNKTDINEHNSYDVDCKVDYKGAEYLYVSLEEEYSSLSRNQFVREPYLAHFTCRNISPYYYSWIDVTVENEYGSDMYTIELPPLSNLSKKKLHRRAVLQKVTEYITSIRVYDSNGFYLNTIKELEETIKMSPGMYILKFFNGNTLVKSSKLLK